MRFIPTKVHGALDYLIGAILVVAPWLLGFSESEAATWSAVVAGAVIILYSLFTDYELGAVRSLSMPGHLWLDGLVGFLLAISPWVLGYADIVWAPHVIVGLMEIGAALTTSTTPAYGPDRTTRLAETGSSATSTASASTDSTSRLDSPGATRPAATPPRPAAPPRSTTPDRERTSR